MTLHVFTARLSQIATDPDRFDVTRSSGGAAGSPFAPSWKTLDPALRTRDRAKALRADAAGIEGEPLFLTDALRARAAELRAEADRLEADAWVTYVPLYRAEMVLSRARHAEAWQALLARPRVVIACHCPARERCHRGLLAEDLVGLGAVDGGEIL